MLDWGEQGITQGTQDMNNKILTQTKFETTKNDTMNQEMWDMHAQVVK